MHARRYLRESPVLHLYRYFRDSYSRSGVYLKGTGQPYVCSAALARIFKHVPERIQLTLTNYPRRNAVEIRLYKRIMLSMGVRWRLANSKAAMPAYDALTTLLLQDLQGFPPWRDLQADCSISVWLSVAEMHEE